MNYKSLSNKVEHLPIRLSNMYDKPDNLFILGAPIVDDLPHVAIVGSRRPSAYGIEMAERLSASLARSGVVIISGLAIGIDGAVHRAAIDTGGRTVAVMPAGLDNIYPKSHEKLAGDILNSGSTLLSEYPEQTAVRKHQFIACNRIIAGLADATVVVEATDRSGSLTTANFAIDMGREVMALPGEATSALSVGTNNLIRLGAEIVTKPEDIINVLDLDVFVKTSEAVAANEDEATLIKLLSAGVVESEELQIKSELSANDYNRTITMLEINGQVKNIGAGKYVLS